ncbi:tape measure domain-containing protein [Falsiroseomonas bella]|uniref:Tape measure domain-containing protein n=1 Tax=Falsiroseomonas bella TaxID=2184016 RepID=A0A317F6A3_9PROT|nr:tape measure protein [Falsiroseomonas bella]PWS34554.1 tape measure domain-containing protein [Falsiroseomonas bella]
MADSTRRVSVRLSLDDAARVKAGLREVGETGQRSLERIRDGADTASRALSLMDVATRGIQLAGVAVAARALVQAGDALTQGLSRLQTATGSVERAGQVYEALYRNALQTGVAVGESVDAFQRFSIAAREIGATSDQVVRLVGGLQRVAIVSGASTTEISSATLQLAQALASGVLQGDELRSILEAMPLLAEGLAKELGVSIGELRRLGSEGRLTAERVFPALLRATERLGAELDKAPLSLGRAFGQLTAATENFLGQLDRAVGLSNALARGLSAAARGMDGTRRGIGLLDEGERLADLQRQAATLSAEIGRLEAEGDGRPSLRAPVRRGSIRPGLVGTAESQAGVDRSQRLEELRQNYFAVLAEIDTAERGALTRRLEEQERAGQAATEARRRRATQDVLDLRRDLDDRFRITREYDERVRRLREAEAAGAIDAAERTRLEALATGERDEALRRLEGTTRRVVAAQRDNRDAEREVNDVLRERERLIQDNETAYERYARRLERLGDLVQRSERAGRPLPEETIGREANAAIAELETAEGRLRENTERTGDAARELGLAFSSAFEDAVVEGRGFGELLKGLERDLLHIGTRKLVTEPLANAATGLLNSALAGIGSLLGGPAVASARGNAFGPGGLIPFATGGIVDRPTLFPFARGVGLMGEAGPEAILPLRRGHNGRLGVEATATPINVVFNVTTPDAGSFRASQGAILGELNRALRRSQRSI